MCKVCLSIGFSLSSMSFVLANGNELIISRLWFDRWSHLDDDDEEMFEQLFKNIQCHLQAKQIDWILTSINLFYLRKETKDSIERASTRKKSLVFHYYIHYNQMWNIIFSNSLINVDLSYSDYITHPRAYNHQCCFFLYCFDKIRSANFPGIDNCLHGRITYHLNGGF